MAPFFRAYLIPVVTAALLGLLSFFLLSEYRSHRLAVPQRNVSVELDMSRNLARMHREVVSLGAALTLDHALGRAVPGREAEQWLDIISMRLSTLRDESDVQARADYTPEQLQSHVDALSRAFQAKTPVNEIMPLWSALRNEIEDRDSQASIQISNLLRLQSESIEHHASSELNSVFIVMFFIFIIVVLLFRLSDNQRKEEYRRRCYQQFFDEGGLPALLLDPVTLQVVEANAAACRFYRGDARSQDELAGISFLSLCRTQVEEAVRLLRTVDVGRALALEMTHLTAGQQERMVVTHATALVVDRRRLLHLSVTDLSQRVAAERALKASESRYRALIRHAPVGILICQRSTGVLCLVNEALCALASADQEQLIGVSVSEVLRVSTEGGQGEAVPQTTAFVLDLLMRASGSGSGETLGSGAASGALSARLIGRSGGEIPVQLSPLPLGIFAGEDAAAGEEGTADDWMIVIVQDDRPRQVITALSQTYASILDSTSDGLLCLDRENRLTRINHAGREMLRLGEPFALPCPLSSVIRDEELQQTVLQLIERGRSKAKPKAALFYASSEEVEKGGVAALEITLSHLTLSSGVSSSALSAETLGQLRGGDVILALHDVSNRIRHQQELERSNAELASFAYILSHDLQEPLRTASGFLQLLQRHCAPALDEQGHEFLGFVTASLLRMREMISGLLSYSRINTQGQELSPIAMMDCVAVALQNLQQAVSEAQATIHYEGDLPTVMADRGQVIHLLQNLIGNALKYRSPDRPCQITLRARRPPELLAVGPEQWQIDVVDTGIGIPEKHFESVFLPFKRLNAASQYPGTGIGLSVCRRIVERHHGQVWVRSVEGEGSCFSFTLPAPPQSDQASDS